MNDGFGRRHRVIKAGPSWYGACGICLRTVWHLEWRVAFDLLELHVKDHADG